MALEIKQSFRLAQQLVVTPQLQQAIKLLQLSRLELTNLIQKELLENPVLEESAEEEESAEQTKQSSGEIHEQAKDADHGNHDHVSDEVGNKDGELKEPTNFDWENYINSYNASGYDGERDPMISSSDESPTYENVLRQGESLQDHLLWQLQLGTFNDDQKGVGIEIIGNINDDGYLTASLQEISAKASAPIELAEEMVTVIQSFDPLGVCARDLEECLLLQVRQLGEHEEEITLLVRHHLEDLERRDYKRIAKKTQMGEELVRELALVIASLEPKPGRPYSTETPQYITPDVYVSKAGEDYLITLNDDGLPKLRINRLYRHSLMKGSEVGGTAKEYIQERLRAAMWLIKSIHQRQRTLYRVTKSIVTFQRDFFDKGIVFLKPLVLKDVAEDIGMHESTISRVTTNKYMHSPRGIFELKFFFNSGIHQLEGGGVASEAVKSRIQELITAEDVTHPLSDQSIAEKLRAHNIDIARRTVAKYREMLGVAPSSKRRRLEG